MIDLNKPIRRKSDGMRMFYWGIRNEKHCLEPDRGLAILVTDDELSAYENFHVDIENRAWAEMAFYRDLLPTPEKKNETTP